MSGGSFDYLFVDFPMNVQDLRSKLRPMADSLIGEEGFEVAAADTMAILHLLDEVERRADALAQVWRAHEWWHSCDYGRDQVVSEIEKYAGDNPRRLVGIDVDMVTRTQFESMRGKILRAVKA